MTEQKKSGAGGLLAKAETQRGERLVPTNWEGYERPYLSI